MREKPFDLPQLGVRPSIPLAKIDAVVAVTLGPARVSGNAQPNAMYRHIAMYLSKHVGGWSTVRIGKFYSRIESGGCETLRVMLCSARCLRCATRLRLSSRAGRAKTPSRRMICFDGPLMNELIDRVTDGVLSSSGVLGATDLHWRTLRHSGCTCIVSDIAIPFACAGFRSRARRS